MIRTINSNGSDAQYFSDTIEDVGKAIVQCGAFTSNDPDEASLHVLQVFIEGKCVFTLKSEQCPSFNIAEYMFRP